MLLRRYHEKQRLLDALGDMSRVYLEVADELDKLDAWVSRMPDAGFTEDDPRWSWWHERPRVHSMQAAAEGGVS